MQNLKNIIIKKGWFPQSVQDDRNLEKEKFCFVNIDCDLYEPILAGLEYFYPKMINLDVILVHDYYNEAYAGAKKAVDNLLKNIIYLPCQQEMILAWLYKKN
ncbi:TylF/MycF/NovP-related O-methyltransferase [Campylobacter sp. LR264d]|uniref:TylF/MycF/NovP-related O-methyltransferase n=1 Tax=Campylobacter sp. LR264d TaxID=2593544 RepID=UPI0016801C6D|nr:TylF/MycF/NovP-related O-methyltransferase [Campylobacter sp. LR264d]